MKKIVIVLSLGDKSLSGAIRNMDVTYIDESQMLQSDAVLRSLINLDTAQDLALAQGRMV